MARHGGALRNARRQAAAAAAVKYNPSQRVLLDALASARSEEGRAVRSAKGTSSALVAAIGRARKPLTSAYHDAAVTATAARGDLLGHLASLGPAADPFSAAVAREQAGTTSRAALERANALGELTLRGVQAREGRASSVQNAHRQYATDASAIYRQLVGNAQDRGSFTAQQIGEITAAQRSIRAQNARARLTARTSVANSKRSARTARRGQNLTHRDKVAARGAARTKEAQKTALAVLKGAKPKAETRGSFNFKGYISDVQGLINDGRSHKVSDHQIRANLIDGKNPSGKKYSRDAVNAAFDLTTLGYLSRPNIVALHRRGVRIPKAWRTKPRQSVISPRYPIPH